MEEFFKLVCLVEITNLMLFHSLVSYYKDFNISLVLTVNNQKSPMVENLSFNSINFTYV